MEYIKGLFSSFFGGNYVMPLEEALDILESPEDAADDETKPEEKVSEENYFERTGKITYLDEHFGLIDNNLYFSASDTTNFKIGMTVCYLAYIHENKTKIVRILSEKDPEWESPKEEAHEWCHRKIVGKVCERRGRIVVVEPNNIECDLNKIESEFIPIVGDWVQLESVVEIDEKEINLSGQVLEIAKIVPLRCKLIEGSIKRYDPDLEEGVINQDVLFFKDSCTPGYVPIVRDKVTVEIIESDQGVCVWRALKVMPCEDSPNKHYSIADTPEQIELLKNKNGIIISDNLSVTLNSIGDKTMVPMEVINTSNIPQSIIAAVFSSNESQLTLKSPIFDDHLLIRPKQTVVFIFLCVAKSMGLTKELFTLNFEGFSIGRWVKIQVVPDYQRKNYIKNYYQRNEKNLTKSARTSFLNSNKEVVIGQRPVKPPSFISNKLPMYDIPERIANILFTQMESCQYVGHIPIENISPCLKVDLSPQNYEDRFHTLLYLEELALQVNMRRYDIERAVFVKNNEFLMLEVQDLSERRPSIIIGDKVIATNPNDPNSQRLEGFVHKTSLKHLYIKFNPNFHNMYKNEDYSVEFHSSRTNFRRYHQAVDLSMRNLGKQFLFPTCVPYKKPQVCFDCEDAAQTSFSSSLENSQDDKPQQEIKSKAIDDLLLENPREDKRELDNSETSSISSSLENSRACKSETASETSSVSSSSLENSKEDKSKQEIKSKYVKLARSAMLKKKSRQSKSPNSSTSDKGSERNLENGSEKEGSEKNLGTERSSVGESEAVTGKATEANLTRSLERSMKRNVELEGTERDSKERDSEGNLEKREATGLKGNLAKGERNRRKDLRRGPQGPLSKLRLEWFDKKLNHFQKMAVKNILIGEARPLPYFIFGPPGTGKTITLIETILQILRMMPHSRLLVVAPSNSAADLLALRLLDSGVLQPGDMVRMVAFRCVTEGSIPERLLPYCVTGDLAREGSRESRSHMQNGVNIGVQASSLGRHRITIGTCMVVGVLYTMGFSRGHFTHIIIDEAGQATEPEIMIPLSLLDVTSAQAVLAGDPLQLGPCVFSLLSKEYGLGDSFFERLINRFPYVRDPIGFPETGGYDPRLVTRLIYNYRSLPEILALPNSLFYNSELQPVISAERGEEVDLLKQVSEILPGRKGLPPAVIFHGVRGENFQTVDCPSWFNLVEAGQVFYYITSLYRLGVQAKDIGVITPYIKQGQQVRSLLSEVNLELPKIGSVEEFQGQEFRVVILTTVRSNETGAKNDAKYGLGFIASPRRLNVAISRAQALLIIVGNPHLLYTDNYWRSVLLYAYRIGGYRGCDLPNLPVLNS